jgi:hypothetical protein
MYICIVLKIKVMATTKKTKASNAMIDDKSIISLYMNFVLEHQSTPKNVYTFCKDNGIEESQFYSFFGSFDSLRQNIWVKFFENAIATIEKEAAFESYSNKNKLLTLYFTLFEILTLNRSYVLYSLKENNEGLKNLKDLKLLRKEMKDFVVTIMQSNLEKNNDKLSRVTEPVFSEGAWIQFLFILKFWMDDTSKSFEKTDVLIEKSVNTVVDLLDTKPLESLFDLGKFLWKINK